MTQKSEIKSFFFRRTEINRVCLNFEEAIQVLYWEFVLELPIRTGELHLSKFSALLFRVGRPFWKHSQSLHPFKAGVPLLLYHK